MSQLEVDKVIPQSGTTITIGDSGDTVNLVGTLQNNGSPLPGDISEVIAGTGLSGGGTTGAVTINIDSAQPTITSLGTLTSATISGDLTVDTNTLFVDSSNNRVGIGTTSPGFEFEVKDASGASVVRVNNGSANHIVDLIADGTGGLLRTVGSYPLVFNTNQTERARIDTSGRLLVGKTSTTRTVVGAELRPDGFIRGTKDASHSLDVVRTTDDGDAIRIYKDNTNVGVLGTQKWGIGNSNPQNKLDITALTWDDGLTIKNTGNFNVGIIGDANRSGAGGGLLNLQARWNGTEVAGILFQAGSDTTNKDDGEILFRTASAGTPTERMRITSAGRIGIGSSSPGTHDAVLIENGQSYLTIKDPQQAGLKIKSDDTAVIYSYDRSSDAITGGITFAHADGQTEFKTGGNNTRMTIKTDGNVGIGLTAPDSKLHVVNTGGQAAKIHSDTNNSGDLGMSVLAGLDTASSSGDCKWVRLADGNDSGKAYIQFKSSSPNAEFAAISDERLKTNIQDTDVVGLDVINNLRLVKFDWNDTATQNAGWSMTGHQKLGFVAQEVEQILPEFISEDTNGFKIMGDSGFVPYLIKAMQEQQTKIQELEARITTLENA